MVIELTASLSSYSILVDRFTTIIRQKSLSLPNIWSLFFMRGFFSPIVIFNKLISQEQSFFNLTFVDFDSVWQTYFLQIHTKSCYKDVSSFIGYSHLLLEPAQLNEYFWPFMPVKGSNFQFTLRLNRPIRKLNMPVTLLLHLEPNCGYEILSQFSLIDSSAQFVKHYFTLLVPIIVSTAILVFSIQLSNVLLLYSFSSKELEKFKTDYNQAFNGNRIANKKCYIYSTTNQVMVNWRYFIYCFSQINLFTIICVIVLKRFDNSLIFVFI